MYINSMRVVKYRSVNQFEEIDARQHLQTFVFVFHFHSKAESNNKNTMLESLYSLPFLILEVPNLKIKQPSWLHQPSPMAVFTLVLFSYFLVTGGTCGCAFFSHLRNEIYTESLQI